MKSIGETEWKCTVCEAILSKGNYGGYYLDAESFDNYFAVKCKQQTGYLISIYQPANNKQH